MFRLVSLPDSVLDRNDLAVHLMFPSVSSGHGRMTRFMVSGLTIEPFFTHGVTQQTFLEATLAIQGFYSQQIQINDKIFNIPD